MIRTENISVSINGNTAYPDSVSIEASVNNAYNSLALTGLSLTGSVGDNIRVTVNGIVYDYIITEKTYQSFGKYTVKGFSAPYVLDEKKLNLDTVMYQDSNTLIRDNKGDVEVVNNIPNIVFNDVTYNNDGSVLNGMLDMLRVIGGECYEQDGVLHLDIFKTITENETPVCELADGEVVSHSFTDNIVSTNKIKNVLINPITDDIYSIPQVSIDFDNDNNKGIILFNPSINANSTYIIQGINPSPFNSTTSAIDYKESFALNDETVITTLGGIDSIVSLSIDDVLLTDADYEHYPTHNKIRFLAKQTGQCVIVYQTYRLKFNISSDVDVLIRYKTALLETKLEYYSKSYTDHDTKITIPDDIILDNGAGTVRIIPPFMFGGDGAIVSSSDVGYDVIFSNSADIDNYDNLELIKTYTLPDDGVVNVYAKYKTGKFWDSAFLYNATTEKIGDVTVEEFKVGDKQYDGLYHYSLMETPLAVYGVTSNGKDISSGTDYDVYNSDFVLRNLDLHDTIFKISYGTSKDKITFPLPTPDNNVNNVEVRVKDNGSSSLDFLNPSHNLCVVPSTINVNIAEKLNISVAQAYGGQVTGDFGTLTVDYFGNVEVYISNKRLYVLDTSQIVPFSSITIDARGVV